MKYGLSVSTAFKLLAVAAVLILAVGTNLFSNAWMMLVDRESTLPAESSIFSFKPYVINQGSSNYWIYGQDREHYFFFSYEPAVPYLFILKSNTCPGFDRLNVKTWCSAKPGAKA